MLSWMIHTNIIMMAAIIQMVFTADSKKELENVHSVCWIPQVPTVRFAYKKGTIS